LWISCITSTSDGDQWPDEGPLWPPGQFHRTPGRRLYHLTWTRGKSPKLQLFWEGPLFVITQMNNLVFQTEQHPRATVMMVHLDRMTPYLGATQDEQP
jgi:hypothetical protein